MSRKFIPSGSMGRGLDDIPDIMAQAVAQDRQKSGRGAQPTESASTQADSQEDTQADKQALEQILAQAHAQTEEDNDTINTAQINAHDNTHRLKQVRTQARTEAPEPASKQVRERSITGARPQARSQASEQVRTQTDKGASARTVRQSPKPLREHAAAPVESADTGDVIADRVRTALSRKVIYPSGRKYSVETPIDIAERIDEYCHDKGKIPARQVFLELMMAFLDEEGY